MVTRGELIETIQTYRKTHGPEILRAFAELLAIPNTADHTEGLRRNAEYLRDALASCDGVRSELFEIEGAAPVVYGEYRVPGPRRTLLLYAHYDGQPARSEQWTNAPWTPALYDGPIDAGGRSLRFPEEGQAVAPGWRIYGRSASDDKASIAAILGALKALQETGHSPSVHLKFFFEGEEEVGSPHLQQYLKTYRDRLSADALLVCDGPVHQSGRPQLFFGARGYAGLELTAYGPARHLHSGHYGNWAPNPNMMLARLLASMKGEDGTVRIEGFYDSVEALSRAEKEALKKVPDIDDTLREKLGLAWTEKGNAPLNERLLLPSLNVRGLHGGGVGDEAENRIPAVAHASIDMRLVKGNRPGDMFELVEQHIREQGCHLVRSEPDLELRRQHRKIVRVARGASYPAVRTRMDNPIVQEIIQVVQRVALAGEMASGGASREQVVLLPSLGASLPLYMLKELELPIVGVPIANYDNNQHGPDENLKVDNLWYGIDLFASLFAMGSDASKTSATPASPLQESTNPS